MPALNPRVNVVLDKDIYQQVRSLAQKQGISLSLKVRDLVAQALSLDEDKFWLEKAGERRKSLDSAKLLTHDAVWKK